jgi:Bax protein
MRLYRTIMKPFSVHFSYHLTRLFSILCCFAWLCSPGYAAAGNNTYEIVVHPSLVEDSIEFFKSKNFWGEETHDKDLDVPRIIVVVTSKRWDEESKTIPVEIKKEIFYRALLPMILLAQELILKERQELLEIQKNLGKRKTLSREEMSYLQAISKKYRLSGQDNPGKQVAQLLERVDIIPASLALGQTAYESGYGTSRFAIEGNALFGQWTYSGDGMKPLEHRESKGDYAVAAYKWPFDSVRSYMLNLNTHSAYQGLRDKRAVLRKQGKKATALSLADTLTSYSEKGGEYIKTLKSIITVNGLEVADNAYLRNEPTTLIVAVADASKVSETESEIEKLRASGELDRIIKSMRLDEAK